MSRSLSQTHRALSDSIYSQEFHAPDQEPTIESDNPRFDIALVTYTIHSSGVNSSLEFRTKNEPSIDFLHYGSSKESPEN